MVSRPTGRRVTVRDIAAQTAVSSQPSPGAPAARLMSRPTPRSGATRRRTARRADPGLGRGCGPRRARRRLPALPLRTDRLLRADRFRHRRDPGAARAPWCSTQLRPPRSHRPAVASVAAWHRRRDRDPAAGTQRAAGRAARLEIPRRRGRSAHPDTPRHRRRLGHALRRSAQHDRAPAADRPDTGGRNSHTPALSALRTHCAAGGAKVRRSGGQLDDNRFTQHA
jgi:hypothetical protein